MLTANLRLRDGFVVPVPIREENGWPGIYYLRVTQPWLQSYLGQIHAPKLDGIEQLKFQFVSAEGNEAWYREVGV